MTIKQNANLLNRRKSIKVIINGEHPKKRNSEFISFNKFLKKSIEIETPPTKTRISILDNEEFFNIIKMDPRLDVYYNLI